MNFEQGEILLINKPSHWTSFDVVNKIRYLIKTKVGHAGTLDPLATGLLILCTGKFTKKLSEFQNHDKEYQGNFFIGATTPSHDSETAIAQQYDTSHITEKIILDTVEKFKGEILQTPPVYSAINVSGQRAYKSARKGISLQMQPRKVVIKEFEIKKIELPLIEFRVLCSKGTYIRSLAYDFGKALNSGAYLASLCRTRVGEYKLEDAWNLEGLVDMLKKMLKNNFAV